MSVCVLSDEEYQRIGVTLLTDLQYRHEHEWAALPSRVRNQCAADAARNPEHGEHERMREDLLYWLRRLHVANQCAYILNYEHRDDLDTTIRLLETGGIMDRYWSYGPREMLTKLQLILYNLHTFTGKVMLGAEDLSRLEAVIGSYMARLIETHDHQERMREADEKARATRTVAEA